MPTPGCTWLGVYLVEETETLENEEQVWLGVHTQSMQRIFIVDVQSPDPCYEKAWDKLRQCNSDRLVLPLEARLVDGRRYSLFSRPEGVSLREWMQKHEPPKVDQLVVWVRDMSQALTALHVNGLVHAHMTPEVIWVEEGEDGKPRLRLGGLEHVVTVERKEPLVIVPDPFYAPPECLDDSAYEPSDSLREWDWWTLGRIIQELVLGRHILEHLVDHSLNRFHPEDRDFAESLLRETAHGNTRAGGVEAMPAMDKRVDLLLCGLLTSAKDGRWGREDVRLWLDGATPRDLYKLARHERLFRFKERAYTVQEAAELLQSAEHWDEARKQLANADDPTTLIAFLRSDAVFADHLRRLDDVKLAGQAQDLKNFNPLAVREALLVLSLQRLAGGMMVWKGRRLDEPGIREILAVDDPRNDHVTMLGVLACPVLVKAYETQAPTTARIVQEGVQVATKAVDALVKERWMPRNAAKDVVRVWRLAFETGAARQAALQELRKLYARSSNETVQALFAQTTLAPEEVLILVWMAPQAVARFGFLSHEIWGETQRAEMEAEAHRLAEQLFWHSLKRVLQMGPAWFGSPVTILALGTVAGFAISFGWPGAEHLPGALLPLLGAFVVRMILPQYVQPRIPVRIASGREWRWYDGPGRCRRELLSHSDRVLTVEELQERLKDLNEKLAGMRRADESATQQSKPSRFRMLIAAAALSWVVLLVPAGAGLHAGFSRPEPWSHFVNTWNPKEPDIEWYPAPQEYKVPFPFTVPRSAARVKVMRMGVANPETIKLANRRGGYYVQDYHGKDISVPVLVRVTDDDLYGFMLFDAKSGKVMSSAIYYFAVVPRKKSFVSVDGQVVFVPDW